MRGVVSELWRYPVKSMAGESLQSFDVQREGVVGDRLFALRDVATGNVISAKKPRPWGRLLHYRAMIIDGAVRVVAPEGDVYIIDDSSLPAVLAERFQREVSVAAAAASDGREQYESEWPDLAGMTVTGEHTFPTNLAGNATPFVDLAAVHLITTATLRRIAELVPDCDVTSARFRPNVVVDLPDLEPFAENDWAGATISLGHGVELNVDMATMRCIMTTLDQPGLGRRPEVLRALAEHNRVTGPWGTFAMAGAYASVIATGTVRVGDPVVVTPAAPPTS